MEKKRYNDVFIIKETEVLVDGFLFRKRNGIYFYCVNCHIGIKLLKSDHGYEAITTNIQFTTTDYKLSMHKAHTIEDSFINSKVKLSVAFSGEWLDMRQTGIQSMKIKLLQWKRDLFT